MNNLQGRASVQLDTFSGVVTLAQAHDLPEGASPRTQNTDFSVGSVFTRQGLTNLFSYEGNFAGPRGGGSAVDNGGGYSGWENPGNILLDDESYATTDLTDTQTFAISTVQVFQYSTNPRIPFAPVAYALLATFTEDVPTPFLGQTCTFSGLTNYPALNGQTVAALPFIQFGVFPHEGFITPAANQVLAAYGTEAYAATSDTGTGVVSPAGGTDSNTLLVTQFSFDVPMAGQITGVVASLKGYSSTGANQQSINITLTSGGSPLGSAKSVSLPGSDTAMTAGTPTDSWGTSLTSALVNATTFGVSIQAEGLGITYLDYVTLTVYFSNTSTDFNFVQTFEDDFSTIRTVALDGNGEFWVENVNTDPDVLVPLFTGVPSNSFSTGFTADSREYLAISDGSQGNYQPTQYTGQWVDRVSQVGPGAPPAFTGTLATSVTAPITAYSYSSGVLTLTAANTFSAGEVVVIYTPSGDALFALNGLAFNVLGTGLSTSQFEIATSLITGSGSSSATATGQYTYPIAASPNGITQFPFWNAAQGYQSGLDAILWSAGPGSTDAGNVITIYYLQGSHGVPDANLVAAFNNQKFPVYVYVSGTDQPLANGTQLVTSVGVGFPPGGAATRWYFTFNVNSTGAQNLGGGSNSQPGTYQLTVATLATTLPLPGVQVGDSLTTSGVGVSEWDNTWPIVAALNSGSYSISETEMTSGTATYNWALSGSTTTPPAVGQLVTVTGALNGNGIFNVTDASIASVTGSASGTFTITGFANNLNYSTQTEVGQATTSGTQFQIDPGPLTLGDPSADPIYGNSGGGFITLVGSSSVTITPGTRMGTVFFISRNGYWTRPAPGVQFTITENVNYILASTIPIGPPDTIGRALVFTEAGQEGQPGASYYTIPDPVQFVYNGVTYTSSSLFIWDNTTTTARLTFTDAVLLNATEIDIQGGDLFSMAELPPAAWNCKYAGRAVYGRVRNAIQNFVNLSFDGGYNSNPGSSLTPLGWGLDNNTIQAGTPPVLTPPTLLVSPIFGNTYYIQNQTGASMPVLDMITQSAYQDWLNVPILQNQTAYSVRVTCRTPSSSTVGNLVVDLTSYNAASGYGQTYGSFSLALSSMTTNMTTYSGTLLTNEFLTVPSDVLLRVWGQNFAANADCEIDRIDIFPTIEPTNLTQLAISYKDSLDSFDQDTGFPDTNTFNDQPANGAFVMRDLLYVLKESSMGYFSDSPGQEPEQWSPFKEVSNIAGACGINAYDVGREWAVFACQSGLYLFNGGEPIPCQLEIPDIWQAINWDAAACIVVRNDTTNSRILISVPMTTPNQWCPAFPAATNPTTPNVMICLNYEGIGTIQELMDGMSLHMTIMGTLAVHDLKRKWSLWSIPSPYMAICKRSELNSEMLFCNGIGSSKIYFLDSYTSGADDGVPFPSSYCTYGFVDKTKVKENPMFGMFNKRFAYYDLL